jgi:hypothetical protein
MRRPPLQISDLPRRGCHHLESTGPRSCPKGIRPPSLSPPASIGESFSRWLLTMRRLALFLVLVTMMLSGCAGWVVFGHTIGEGHPTPAGQSAPQVPVAPQAPVVPRTPVAPQTGAAPQTTVASRVSAALPAGSKLTAVRVSFTPEVKKKVNADPRFKDGALLTAIERELRSRKLLNDNDPADATADRTVEVVIDDFATGASSNAVVFGYVLGTGTLAGIIDVRDAAGQELQTFRIKTDSRLATPADDEQAQPLQALYHKFADLTVDNLTGVPQKPDQTSNNEVPR